jgi:hypothetical protein
MGETEGDPAIISGRAPAMAAPGYLRAMVIVGLSRFP